MDKIPWWVWAVGLGGVGYLIYRAVSAAPAAVNSALDTVSTGIANIWLSLPGLQLPPAMQVLGSVVLPNGNQVTLNSLNGKIRQDSNGNVYANIGGSIYQLSPSDSSGNYPATLVGLAPAGG